LWSSGRAGWAVLRHSHEEGHPKHEITILERNRLEDTFGFGVVFSDATQNNLAAADPDTYHAMASHFAHWDDIDIHYRGLVIRLPDTGLAGSRVKPY
jgi:anthraniloyl-CoA monooxygenase